MARESLGSNGAVDKCSGAYSAGGYTGDAWGVAFGGGLAAAKAGWTVSFWKRGRYPFTQFGGTQHIII